MLPGDSESPLEGWHQCRLFWVLYSVAFLVAFVWCLFPAKPENSTASSHSSQPLAKKSAAPAAAAPLELPAATMPTPIADTAPSLAWLQGEIVVESPIRTAIRPVEVSPSGASTHR